MKFERGGLIFVFQVFPAGTSSSPGMPVMLPCFRAERPAAEEDTADAVKNN